ncbi:MAG: SRPBCC family protein [Cyclobacteriaceae bacterium]
MPKMNIARSILIGAPAEKVYSILRNFDQWRPWSPWLITEPEAKMTIAEDRRSYEWEGHRTGSGNMNLMDESENEVLSMQLNFIKPWKSTAKVRFELKPEGEGTKVIWSMDSGLPFFMFWMTKMMTALISSDYDRGLSMLKEYVETGSVSSKLDFKGISNFEGCRYVGIRSSCDIDKLGDQMKSDFGKLKTYLE